MRKYTFFLFVIFITVISCTNENAESTNLSKTGDEIDSEYIDSLESTINSLLIVQDLLSEENTQLLQNNKKLEHEKIDLRYKVDSLISCLRIIKETGRKKDAEVVRLFDESKKVIQKSNNIIQESKSCNNASLAENSETNSNSVNKNNKKKINNHNNNNNLDFIANKEEKPLNTEHQRQLSEKEEQINNLKDSIEKITHYAKIVNINFEINCKPHLVLISKVENENKYKGDDIQNISVSFEVSKGQYNEKSTILYFSLVTVKGVYKSEEGGTFKIGNKFFSYTTSSVVEINDNPIHKKINIPFPEKIENGLLRIEVYDKKGLLAGTSTEIY